MVAISSIPMSSLMPLNVSCVCQLPITPFLSIKVILAQLTRVELDQQVKNETIKVRRSTQMKLPDSIISASASVAAATLVTDDVKLADKHAGNVISLDTLLSR